MTCRQCGTEIADKALICYRCGTPTTEAKYRAAAPAGWRMPALGIVAMVLAIVALALLGFYLLSSG